MHWGPIKYSKSIHSIRVGPGGVEEGLGMLNAKWDRVGPRVGVEWGRVGLRRGWACKAEDQLPYGKSNSNFCAPPRSRRGRRILRAHRKQ